MKFSKAYLNENIKDSLNQKPLSGLYVIALKLIEALDPAHNPVAAYREIAEAINSGSVDPHKVFSPMHWQVFQRIQEEFKQGLHPISDIIEMDKGIQTGILGAYNRMKRYMEMNTPEQSQSTEDIKSEFTSDDLKNVFSELNKIMTEYLTKLDGYKQAFDQLFAHVPVTDGTDELKVEIDKIYNYLKHELGITNDSLERGAAGLLDLNVNMNNADTSLAEPVTESPAGWPRQHSKFGADAKTEAFKLLQKWYDFNNFYQQKFDNLWKHYFFRSTEKGNLGRTIIDKLAKTTETDKRTQLWSEFSGYLNNVTKNFGKQVSPYIGKNQLFPQELLEEAHRILKWNMVKVIGDFNIAKSDMARLMDENTNPLTRKAPQQEQQTPIDIYRVPFHMFYDKLKDNMGTVYEYLSTTMEKVQELSTKVPDTKYAGFADIIKKVDEVIGKGYREITEVQQKFAPKKAQQTDESAIVVQQLNQYIQTTQTNIGLIEQFLNKARNELQRLEQRPGLSEEDGNHINELVAVLQDMLNGLREQRLSIDALKKGLEEAGKSNYQKLKEWWVNNKSNIGDKGKAIVDFMSGK